MGRENESQLGFGIPRFDRYLPHAMLLLGVALGTTAGSAQQASPSGFDTVSLKRSVAETSPPFQAPVPNGGFTATNVTLQMLVSGAFRIRGSQLVGGPEWVRRDRFDILAQGNRTVSIDDLRSMVQALIKERFHLAFSEDRRKVPTYILQTINNRGVSPGMERAADGCEAQRLARLRDPSLGRGNVPISTERMIAGTCVPMSRLASALAVILEAEVVDTTALSGSWNYRLMVDPSRPLPQGQSRAKAVAALQSAIAGQLGLRLEEERRPMDVLVIKSVRYPDQ